MKKINWNAIAICVALATWSITTYLDNSAQRDWQTYLDGQVESIQEDINPLEIKIKDTINIKSTK